jgi:hypothetical protein
MTPPCAVELLPRLFGLVVVVGRARLQRLTRALLASWS